MTEPTPAPVAYEDEPSGGLLQNKKALAGIGVGVVAVVALGGFVLLPMLSGSSSSGANPPVAAGKHRTAATASPTGIASAAPGGVVTAAPALGQRDPFKPLVTEPSAAPASSAAPTAAPTISSNPSQGPTIILVQPTSGGGTATTQRATYSVKLVSVNGNSATFTVNGTSYTATAGSSNAAAANFPSAANGPFQLAATRSTGDVDLMYGSEDTTMHVNETRVFS